MHTKAISKILGLLLLAFSITLLPPLAISVATDDGALLPLAVALALNLIFGLACWLPHTSYHGELRIRDGFVVVVLFWTVLSVMAAVPLVLLKTPHLSVVDALFESMSGLTTTGATILKEVEQLPISVLYYRQQLQWLGGMGIIVLAVAVMPMLGVGGMQLYRAETPGPEKNNKLTPRIKETAKGLWYIYVGLTAVCAACYYFAGMSPFDAIAHAFSTIAIGGFSTHSESIAFFDSNAVNLVALIFMILAGLNFALHFTAFKNRSALVYARDPEARAYLFLLLSVVAVCFIALHYYTANGGDFLQNAVQIVSVATTTGFITTEFSAWPTFLPIMLLLLSCAGGCAGSTASGMKIIRVLLLCKQGAREISRLVHPNAMLPIKVGKRVASENVINAVWGFLALYLISYMVLLILLLATGLDAVSAFSAVTACLNNLGPGLGVVAHDYASVNNAGKIILTFAMLLGRLELFTLLILFTPVFWKG